jgi:two-component system response regulator FixJ
MQVVVVDDDDSVRQAIERLLAAADFEARTFDSAEALLARGPIPNVVCVVSDLLMPAMSGLELLTELRARGCSSPFILMTGHDAPGQREEASRRGAAAYLVKPFHGMALLDAIRASLQHHIA